MDLRQRQARELSVNLVRVPMVCQMALCDFQDFRVRPVNEGYALVIQFNKGPCRGNHNQISGTQHHAGIIIAIREVYPTESVGDRTKCPGRQQV